MKRITIALAAVAALALSGCSTLKTNADYDTTKDFSKYKTFGFKSVDEIKNNILDERIKSSVGAQLTAKGWSRNDANPDVWVVPHARLSKQTQINTYNTGWGYGYGWRGAGMGTQTSTVSEIPVGTLIIDMVDAKANEMIWRGTASDTLPEKATPEEREKNLNAAMAKLFEGFPPPKK
jgi:hypothetical protein